MSRLSADEASLLETFQQRQEGTLERKKKGGFGCMSAWVSEWFVVSPEYIVSFVSRTSGQVQLCVSLSAVTSVEPDVKAGAFRLRYAPQIGKSPCDAAAVELVLKAEKEETARRWVTAITEAQERRRRDSTFIPLSFVQGRLLASQQINGELRERLAGAEAEVLQVGKSSTQAEIKARHELACQRLTAILIFRERNAVGNAIASLASHASIQQSYHAAIAASRLAFALDQLPRASCATALGRWRGLASGSCRPARDTELLQSCLQKRLRQWHRDHTSFRACCSRSIRLCEAVQLCESAERKALLKAFVALRSGLGLGPQLSSTEIQTETVGTCSAEMQTEAAGLCSEVGVQAGLVCSYTSVEIQTDADSELCSGETPTDAACMHASIGVQTDDIGSHTSVQVQTDAACSSANVETQTSVCLEAEPQVAFAAGVHARDFWNPVAVDPPRRMPPGNGIPPLARDIPLDGRIAAATSAVLDIKTGITKLEERLGQVALRTASSMTVAMAAAQAEFQSQKDSEESVRRAEGAYEKRWWHNLAEVVVSEDAANNAESKQSQAEHGRGANYFTGISNENVAPSESSFSSGIAFEAPGTAEASSSSDEQLGFDLHENSEPYHVLKPPGAAHHRRGDVGLPGSLELPSPLGHFLVPKGCSAQRPAPPPRPCGLPSATAFQLARSDSSTSLSETASDANSLVRQYAYAWH